MGIGQPARPTLTNTDMKLLLILALAAGAVALPNGNDNTLLGQLGEKSSARQRQLDAATAQMVPADHTSKCIACKGSGWNGNTKCVPCGGDGVYGN